MGPNSIAILSRAYAQCMIRLNDMGFTVTVLHDFEEVSAVLRKAGKSATLQFNTKLFDFNGCNGFCHLVEKDGEPVSTFCSQLMDTGLKNLQEFHWMQLDRLYPAEDSMIDRTWSCPPMTKLTGPLMYSGDACNPVGARTTRSSLERLRLVAKLNLFLGLISWQTIRASVGLARAADVRRGLGAVYGAYHTCPFATRWRQLPDDRRQDDVFLFSHSADILHQAEIEVRGYENPHMEVSD